MTEKLTPEQIENWRAVLCGIVGPYAIMMSHEQIQRFRDKMQADIDKAEIKQEQTCTKN